MYQIYQLQAVYKSGKTMNCIVIGDKAQPFIQLLGEFYIFAVDDNIGDDIITINFLGQLSEDRIFVSGIPNRRN